MEFDVEIRPEAPTEFAAIHAVSLAAFDGDGEAKLVDQLRACDGYLPDLSLVAIVDDQVVGYILLTRAKVVPSGEECATLAMAPVAVLPQWQRHGIGSLLIQRSLADAAELGHELVIVLGHPEYYPRFGFRPASAYGIRCQFDAPDEAFMATWLSGSKPQQLDGVVQYAAPFSALDPQ